MRYATITTWHGRHGKGGSIDHIQLCHFAGRTMSLNLLFMDNNNLESFNLQNNNLFSSFFHHPPPPPPPPHCFEVCEHGKQRIKIERPN